MDTSSYQKNCDKCGVRMQIGFLWTREPIRFMPKERVIPKINSDTDCDIFQNTWRTKNLPGVVRRVLGYHCPTCKILVVDYGRVFVGNESRELAQKLVDEDSHGNVA
jgi:hypothetical protein